jgi:hypothetical protein
MGHFSLVMLVYRMVIQARHHQNVEVRGELGGCTARCPILSPFRGLASGKLT